MINQKHRNNDEDNLHTIFNTIQTISSDLLHLQKRRTLKAQRKFLSQSKSLDQKLSQEKQQLQQTLSQAYYIQLEQQRTAWQQEMAQLQASHQHETADIIFTAAEAQKEREEMLRKELQQEKLIQNRDKVMELERKLSQVEKDREATRRNLEQVLMKQEQYQQQEQRKHQNGDDDDEKDSSSSSSARVMSEKMIQHWKKQADFWESQFQLSSKRLESTKEELENATLRSEDLKRRLVEAEEKTKKHNLLMKQQQLNRSTQPHHSSHKREVSFILDDQEDDDDEQQHLSRKQSSSKNNKNKKVAKFAAAADHEERTANKLPSRFQPHFSPNFLRNHRDLLLSDSTSTSTGFSYGDEDIDDSLKLNISAASSSTSSNNRRKVTDDDDQEEVVGYDDDQQQQKENIHQQQHQELTPKQTGHQKNTKNTRQPVEDRARAVRAIAEQLMKMI